MKRLRQWQVVGSLVTFITFIMVCAIFVAWEIPRARRQREIERLILNSGGQLWLTGLGPGPDGFLWYSKAPLRKALSGEYVDNIYGVRYDSLTPSLVALSRLRDVPGGLQELEFKRTTIGDANWSCVSKLDTLRAFSVFETKISDNGLRTIGCLGSLRELTLCQCMVTDAGMAHLGTLKRLQYLNLCSNPITDTAIVHLESMSQLEWLWLGETGVTGRGLKHLGVLKQLHGLNVSCNRIGDRDLESIEGLVRLIVLHLSETDISDMGLDHLQEAL